MWQLAPSCQDHTYLGEIPEARYLETCRWWPKHLQKMLITYLLDKILCVPVLQSGFHRGGGGGVHRLIFTGYVLLASQSPYPIIVYSVANNNYHRLHHSHLTVGQM